MLLDLTGKKILVTGIANNRSIAWGIAQQLKAAGAELGTMATILGALAVMFATINVVGGYLVTNRMLSMFKKKGSNQPGGKT